MHVAHLYDGHERVHGGRGSVPNVVWQVACETASRGHEVTVIERRWRGQPATASHEGVGFKRLELRTGPDDPWKRVPYEEIRSPLGFSRLVVDRANFARHARRVLARLDLDVLHVHLPFAANVLLALSRGYRDRTVYTAHLGELRLDMLNAGGGGLSVPRVLSLVSPDVWLAKRAAKTTVLNERVRAAFVDRSVPISKLEVIPNGVDLERFGEVEPAVVDEVRERYWPDEGPALLFVGTVMPRKGVDDLVRAVGMLEAGYDRKVQLVIAGEDELDGAYVEEIRALIRERGLTDRVCLVGFVADEELPALYAAADVFVSPSREEGFGMTVAEAMAAGTPVVATRVGGLARLLDAGSCGRLLEPDHPTGLAATLDDLLGDEDQREELAEKAMERVQDFSWEAVGGKFVEVYESIHL